MSSQYLRPLQKTLVVGLGGTGKRVLVELKRRLLEAGYLDSTRQPDLQLICLDFDPAEECAVMRNDGQATVCLAEDETCWLDGNLIHNRLRNLRQEHNLAYYRDWYPDLEGAVIQMGAYRAGAAQWRPLGRIGYYEYAERIQVVLRRGLNRLLEINPERQQADHTRGVAVYIVCSLAGGTGGGTFLDVAYFLRTMPVDLKQIGLFLLPGIYAEYDISGRLYANTYACLKELSTFANQGEIFEARYPNGRRISVPKLGESPFDQVFLYDNILQKDELTNNPKTMAAVMAETIFFDLSSAVVGQMHESATTNSSKEAGGHEDSPLARQSVFSMVGSMTLRLPSLGDLRLLIRQQYLQLGLVKAMEQAQQDLDKGGSLTALLEGGRRASFAKLDTYLDDLVGGTVRACRVWDPAYIQKTKNEMARVILDKRLSPAQYKDQLDTWLTQFVAPTDDGSFTVEPNRLPDVGLGGTGPLQNAVVALREDLGRRLEEILGQAGPEADARAQELFLYLQAKSRSLQAQVQGLKDELRRTLAAPDSPFKDLEKDLLDLLAANPPHEGNLDELAVAHWSRRFLEAVQHYYGQFACQIRVHLLLSKAMDQVCQTTLVDERLYREALLALPLIRRSASQGQQAIIKRLKVGTGPCVVSLVDQGFLERLGQRVAQRLPTGGALLGFLLYVKRQVPAQEMEAGLRPERLLELATEFAQERARQFLNQQQDDILEPQAYVDPRRRAEALRSARHDFMVRDALLNASKNRRAYVAVPTYTAEDSQEGGARVFEEIRSLVGNVLEASTIDVRPYAMQSLDSDLPGRLLVRHLSLNHPATNLRGIGEYYYAYARYGAQRKLFHLDLNFLGLPEVINQDLRLKYVTCGNPGCHEDITEEPRSAIICRHCHRPIRSRCGNNGCPENELHKPRDKWDPQNPDKYCPTCHQLAHTYWWRCQRHNLDLRTESNYCQHCLAEHRAGQLRFEDVSRRQDVKRHLDCPGCLHDCQPEPFRIEFLEVYDEVPDQNTPQAWEVYSQPTRHGCCPKCGAQLLPFCPYHQGQERPHFVHRFQAHSDCAHQESTAGSQVQRRQGPFFCTSDQEHAQRVIKECSFCHLPLKEDATYCPRCKRQRLDEHLEAPQVENQEPKLDVGKIAEWLGSKLAKTDKERERAKAVAVSIRCRVDHQDWLWFGLSQEDWDKMKDPGNQPSQRGRPEVKDCEPQPGGPPQTEGPFGPETPPQPQAGLPPEAAVQYRLGHGEETHEPV